MEEDVRAALLNRYYEDSESLQLQEFVSEALDNFFYKLFTQFMPLCWPTRAPRWGCFPEERASMPGCVTTSTVPPHSGASHWHTGTS